VKPKNHQSATKAKMLIKAKVEKPMSSSDCSQR